MIYRFPTIERIDDVLPHIEGCEEIRPVKLVTGHTMICYMVNKGKETFPDLKFSNHETAIMRRECRGLLFNAKGYLVSRPYHKFFNLGERWETQIYNLRRNMRNGVFTYLDKLDGSMVRPVFVDGRVVLMTKKGWSDVAKVATAFMDENPVIKGFTHGWMDSFTPIFEFCSRKTKVVIDHPVDRLVLTAMRDNLTGEYVDLSTITIPDGVEVVQEAFPSTLDPDDIVSKVKMVVGSEGIVARDPYGHMFKLKGDWYTQIHGSIDLLRFEKDVLRMVLEEKHDDMLPHLAPDIAARLEAYAQAVLTGVYFARYRIKDELEQLWGAVGWDRKRFALEQLSKVSDLSKPFAFQYLHHRQDGSDVEMVKNHILKHCGSSTAVDACREYFRADWSRQDDE